MTTKSNESSSPIFPEAPYHSWQEEEQFATIHAPFEQREQKSGQLYQFQPSLPSSAPIKSTTDTLTMLQDISTAVVKPRRGQTNQNNDQEGNDPSITASPSEKLSPFEVELLPLNTSDQNYKIDDVFVDEQDDKHFKRHNQHLQEQPASPFVNTSALSWSQRWNDWMYPPTVPPQCQLFRLENLAVPLCYLLVGIMQGLSGPFIFVYPLDLGTTEAQQITLSSIRSLPASFKLLFGFLSDTVPINGYRRKSYMFLGWFISALSMGILLQFSNLSLQRIPSSDDDDDGDDRRNGARWLEAEFYDGHQHVVTNSSIIISASVARRISTTVIVPDDAPSVPFLAVNLLVFGIGMWMADVMGDSLVAEKAKLEPPHARGSIQSSCYSYRFFGSMCAAPLSTVLYSTYGPQVIIALLGILPVVILPCIWMLHEIQYDPNVPTIRGQCTEIWSTVCSRAVWQPLGFVFLYNLLQVSNGAWRQYLKTTLDFSPAQLNMLYIAQSILLYLGIVCYKHFLIHWSWRSIYVITTLLNALFSLLQILLILGITFGLSNFVFALGDDVFADFIQGIQFLPATIMMVNLCPAGSEGASYAMFTTMSNVAGNLSAAISTLLLPVWDVRKETLAIPELSGMIKLTLLTTGIQTSAILFVRLLPQFKEDLDGLKHKSFKSTIGGAIFLFVTIASVMYAIVIGIMNVLKPGWIGES